MTSPPKPLSPTISLRVNELACVICDKVATGNFIRCSDCPNAIHYLCTSIPTYQICNFIHSNLKFTCISYTKEEYKDIVHLTMDCTLREFREKLDQLEVGMHLLQTESKMLRGKSVMWSNEIKTLKVMQSSKTEEKESQIKKFQKDLRQANKINKLKRDIVPEFGDIILSRGRINTK